MLDDFRVQFKYFRFLFVCFAAVSMELTVHPTYSIRQKLEKEENLTLSLQFFQIQSKKMNRRHLKHIQDRLKVKCLLKKLVINV